MTNPLIMRGFPTNDRMMSYNRLPHPIVTDTLLSGTASQHGHKFAQVFATSYGCSRNIPMTKKRDAPFALGRLFRHEGAPPEIIIDGSKEQNLGDFARKLRDAGCHRKQIEPHSPWMNLCEVEIRELKRGLTRKMLKQNVPKKLWDHFLELESRIRSATTLPPVAGTPIFCMMLSSKDFVMDIGSRFANALSVRCLMVERGTTWPLLFNIL